MAWHRTGRVEKAANTKRRSAVRQSRRDGCPVAGLLAVRESSGLAPKTLANLANSRCNYTKSGPSDSPNCRMGLQCRRSQRFDDFAAQRFQIRVLRKLCGRDCSNPTISAVSQTTRNSRDTFAGARRQAGLNSRWVTSSFIVRRSSRFSRRLGSRSALEKGEHGERSSRSAAGQFRC